MKENIISTLNEKEKELLKIKTYKKNQVIFNEEEECTSIAIIIKGQISISTYTLLEKTYDIKTLNENDIFGTFLIFSSSPYYLGNVISLKDSTIAFINKNDLYTIISKNQSFYNSYMNLISKSVMKLQGKVKILSQKTIREKILFYIKNEIKRTKNKTIKINSKEELAKILNIPRPSLSRELINMKDLGLIDYSRSHIKILDLEEIENTLVE